MNLFLCDSYNDMGLKPIKMASLEGVLYDCE